MKLPISIALKAPNVRNNSEAVNVSRGLRHESSTVHHSKVSVFNILHTRRRQDRHNVDLSRQPQPDDLARADRLMIFCVLITAALAYLNNCPPESRSAILKGWSLSKISYPKEL